MVAFHNLPHFFPIKFYIKLSIIIACILGILCLAVFSVVKIYKQNELAQGLTERKLYLSGVLQGRKDIRLQALERGYGDFTVTTNNDAELNIEFYWKEVR